MITARFWKQEIGLRLLNFSAWIRSQALLKLIYCRFPSKWRNQVSYALAAPVNAGLKFVKTKRWDASLTSIKVSHLSELNKINSQGCGVNIHAHVRGQFGLAENARLYARALIASGYPVAVCDVDIALPHALEDRSLDAWLGNDAPYPIDLIFINPDHFDKAINNMRGRGFRKRYTVGYWFWELENFPEQWLPALSEVDEVIVASAYVEIALKNATTKPVTKIPVPINEVSDSGLLRSDFGLAENVFIFLCTFDFNSFLERKNPLATIRAFRLAFEVTRNDVCLLIKSNNGFRHPERLRELLNEVDGDTRIVFRDEIIAREHVQALQRCSDAYISLHRAEGFGLGLAEAMRQGKPVLATAYSGNLEFMNEANSLLVKYKMIPVPEGAYLHSEGQSWAEVDLAHAAQLMCRLVDEQGLAERLGRQAALDICEKFSASACAEALIGHLSNISLKASVDTLAKSTNF